MDLAELKFVVITDDLERASKEVAKLGTEVSKLNKPMQDLSKESAKTNKELSKAEEAAAKAALAQLKLEQAQTKSNEATGKSTSVLERQQTILDYMATGLSKGQASYVATAIAAGALDDEIGQLITTLKQQRSLIGGDPFDKSIGLMQKLDNETRIVTEANNLFNRNLGLTEKQMIDLAREKERLIVLYGVEKRSLSGLDAEYEQIVQKSAEINRTNDARTNSMKAQIKAQNDAVKAEEYIANEMERVNRLTQSNGEITSGTNSKLIKFEQALKQSGMTAVQQTAALEKYKQSLLSIQKAGGDRQVDYLSRALGPQITDIFVGLATGQSPMMVLLQQGGQLRDQFALAGVAAKDMGAMLKTATVGMASSVRDVALAVGSAMGGAFIASGKAANEFIMNVTGAKDLLERLRYQIALADGSNGKWMKSFNILSGMINAFTGVIVAGAVAGLVAYGVALKQVIDQESAVSKAIHLTGASLGLTKDSALALSEELAGSKGNVGSYVEAITEIAKAGNITKDNLKTVASTIVNVSKTTGISAETLAKNFSKISEKPLEGLIPFAKELGTINVSVLEHIQKLERAGKHTEAAKIATEAYAQALRDASNAIKEDKGYIESFFSTISELATDTWNSIMNWGRALPKTKQLIEAQKELADLESGKSFYMTEQYHKNSIEVAKAKVKGLEDQIAAEEKLGAKKAKNSKDAAAFEKNLKEQGSAQFKVPEDLYLKRLQEEYKDTTKEIDSESKKLLAENKSKYDLGLIDLGTYLGEEMRLIQSQNSQKVDTNSNYIKSLEAARDIQIRAINDVYAVEIAKTKTTADAAKLEKDRVAAVKSVTEAYHGYTEAAKTNTEVLKDNSAEQQAKSIAHLGEQTKKVIEGSKEFAKSQDDIIAKRVLAVELEQRTAGLYGAAAERVKAQITMEQSHIEKLSELQTAALKAGLALSKLTLSGMNPSDPKFLDAKAAVAAANEALGDAQKKSRESVEKAGYDAVVKYQDLSTQRLNAYGQAFEKMFSGMADAIVEFAKTGKLNFGDLVNSMIADLIRFEMKKQSMSIYEGLGGAKGIMSFFKYAGTSNNVSSANYENQMDLGGFKVNALGNAFGPSGIQAFANGGTFTNSIVDSPTLFKFAKGIGLMGEAGPEAIMPLRRGADGSLGVAATGGSSGNVSVQVINNSNAQATTNETVDSKGNRKIEVVIGDMTAGEISRSGSASQKSIKSTFGLQPQLIRR